MVRSLWQRIEDTDVRPGTLVFWWLYQAGIIVKTPGGTKIAIDPYLSNAVMRSYQISRAVPAPLNASETVVDALLASHSHDDHLDPDSITTFLGHSSVRFIGPPMAVEKVLSAGIPAQQVTSVARGDIVEVGDLTVRAVYARHLFGGEPTPDAVGFILQSDGLTIYHSGDTEYDSQIVADTRGVTASLISINGTTGNMNAYEAALLAYLQGTRLAVPFHYGLWNDDDYGEGATLDPHIFVDTYDHLGGQGRAIVLEASKPVVVGEDGYVV